MVVTDPLRSGSVTTNEPPAVSAQKSWLSKQMSAEAAAAEAVDQTVDDEESASGKARPSLSLGKMKLRAAIRAVSFTNKHKRRFPDGQLQTFMRRNPHRCLRS